jgi:Na+/melibiose symporter-like transporter
LLFAQMVDADQQEHGASRAGIISGATGTMLRVAPALAGFILGEVLTRSGYDPRLPVQPDSVGYALRALTFAGPGLALASTGLLLHRCSMGSASKLDAGSL